MSVYDRWHKSRPRPGEATCGKHKGKVPSAVHGQGLRWQVRGTDDKGRAVKRNFEFEEQAKEAEAALKASVRAGTYVDERAGQVTLRAWAEEWRKSHIGDQATAERIASSFANHVYEDPATPGLTRKGGMAIGEYPIGLLARRPSKIREWISSVNLHPNSVRLLIDCVSPVFGAAVEDGIIARNPFKTKSGKKPPALVRPVTAWSAGQVADVAGALPARWAALAYLGAACGQRQGELFAVSLEDLDFLRRMVHVEVQVKYVSGTLVFAPTKNKRVRDVPVAKPVVDILAAHCDPARFPPVAVTLPWDKPGGRPVTRSLLFTAPGGHALTRPVFNRQWRKAWRAAGIPEADQVNGCHVLRHTAASAWLSRGLNIAKVAAYLGDTVAVVSGTYAHFMPDDDDRARVIMDGFFSGLAERSTAPIPPRALGNQALWLADGVRDQ